MNKHRKTYLKEGKIGKGPVVYWMQRDQRVHDNWALIYAYQRANEINENLIVVFNLITNYLQATFRQYHFMIEGLKEVEENLSILHIPFFITIGNPEDEIPNFIRQNKAALIVTDLNPLKIIEGWKEKVASKITIPFHQIDAHNIVPVWHASDKQEFAAYTIRPKINKLLPEFLDEFPKLKRFNSEKIKSPKINWDKLYKALKIDFSVKPIDSYNPGESAANKLLQYFINNKLSRYSDDRNDPNKNGVSRLSPYLHFGQISAQRIAMILNKFNGNDESIRSYLEELIIRRELSDNFCYYNRDYDNTNGFPDWAKQTLNDHKNDKRDYIYSFAEFETGNTHDDLWNSAQLEMVKTGKMHGYMRMYWAKKIFEWTKGPNEALKIGIYLNDKYELDGRDPNGYVGLAWSIGGVHDRAWTERPIFGKIRYMNYNGCRRKFNVESYIKKFGNKDQ